MTRWPRPRVSSYVDAVSDERLSDVTRSVSLLARCSPIPALSGCAPDVMEEEEEEEEDVEVLTPPWDDRLRRFSGPIV